MIETVLYGRRVLVPNQKFLRMVKSKEALVEEAILFRKAGNFECEDEIVRKIISLNRRIRRTGLFVQYI